MDALFAALEFDEGDAGAAAVADGDDGGQEGDTGKKRKINVRAPLYSLELLADREGMLQYLTGFDRESIDLLTQRLGEVVFLSPSFCSSLLRTLGKLWFCFLT